MQKNKSLKSHSPVESHPEGAKRIKECSKACFNEPSTANMRYDAKALRFVIFDSRHGDASSR